MEKERLEKVLMDTKKALKIVPKVIYTGLKEYLNYGKSFGKAVYWDSEPALGSAITVGAGFLEGSIIGNLAVSTTGNPLFYALVPLVMLARGVQVIYGYEKAKEEESTTSKAKKPQYKELAFD
ncbi:MAG: hypothetical protein M1348_01555 [Candidatus Parvarchaeota archaeon]|jgi:hypothetical protein|nr:hypothetical protein [Candidatus Parvarchaeota archaeon]MCL5101279.1 hypothetical protein [Candidatus Parvarchaeota archaeon]